MGVSPRVPSRCAHWVWRLSGGLRFPIQRSACDYAEVSLSLCTCYRLPRVATPILTYPLYRSLLEEVLARSKSTWLGILTPVQGTYPSIQYSTGCPKKVEINLPSLLLNKVGVLLGVFFAGFWKCHKTRPMVLPLFNTLGLIWHSKALDYFVLHLLGMGEGKIMWSKTKIKDFIMIPSLLLYKGCHFAPVFSEKMKMQLIF